MFDDVLIRHHRNISGEVARASILGFKVCDYWDYHVRSRFE